MKSTGSSRHREHLSFRDRVAKRIWGNRPLARTLGVYQCYGGVLGLVALLDVAPRLMMQAPSEARPSGLALWTVVALLMGALLLGGILLLRGHRLGVRASMGVQLAQLLFFSFGPMSYLFFGGFYLGLAFEHGTLTASAGWQVYAEIGEAAGRNFLGVNLIPLVIVGALKRSLREETPVRPFGYTIGRRQNTATRTTQPGE